MIEITNERSPRIVLAEIPDPASGLPRGPIRAKQGIFDKKERRPRIFDKKERRPRGD